MDADGTVAVAPDALSNDLMQLELATPDYSTLYGVADPVPR